ncbi:hypothetical protein [Lacunimicrobium album]
MKRTPAEEISYRLFEEQNEQQPAIVIKKKESNWLLVWGVGVFGLSLAILLFSSPEEKQSEPLGSDWVGKSEGYNPPTAVNGYTRKDGTKVDTYRRTTRDEAPENNYSHGKNVNPFTGEKSYHYPNSTSTVPEQGKGPSSYVEPAVFFPDDNFVSIAAPVAKIATESPRGIDKLLIDNGVDPTGMTTFEKKQALNELNQMKAAFEAAQRQARRTGRSVDELSLAQLNKLGPKGLEDYRNKQIQDRVAAMKLKQPAEESSVPNLAAASHMQTQMLQQQQQSIWQMQRQIERMERDRISRSQREQNAQEFQDMRNMLPPTFSERQSDYEYILGLERDFGNFYGGGFR